MSRHPASHPDVTAWVGWTAIAFADLYLAGHLLYWWTR